VDRDRRLPLHAELRRDALATAEQAIGRQEACMTLQRRVVASVAVTDASPDQDALLLEAMERHLERLNEWHRRVLDWQD